MTAPVLLTPLRVEAAAARFGARGRRVERVGMGPVRASRAAESLRGALPSMTPVGVLGFARGLDPTDRPGDLVVASELWTADGSLPRRPLAGGLADRVHGALSAVLGRSRLGAIVCSPCLVGGTSAKAAALQTSGALACEMESAWLVPLADGRPFVVVRSIVDRPGRPLFGPWTMTGGLRAWRRLAAAAGVVAAELEQYH
ncbi:MAG: phosphorylase family protein [Acidimicrobiales bacterium]